MPTEKLKNRRRFTAEFKFRVVLTLLRGEKTLSQASAEYQVKDSVLSRWKQEFLERGPSMFQGPAADSRLDELERMLKVQSEEMALLKKALAHLISTRGSSS